MLTKPWEIAEAARDRGMRGGNAGLHSRSTCARLTARDTWSRTGMPRALFKLHTGCTPRTDAAPQSTPQSGARQQCERRARSRRTCWSRQRTFAPLLLVLSTFCRQFCPPPLLSVTLPQKCKIRCLMHTRTHAMRTGTHTHTLANAHTHTEPLNQATTPKPHTPNPHPTTTQPPSTSHIIT